MRAFLRFFSPLRHAATAFFKHDLALRRGASGVELVLEERSEDPARPARPSRQSRAEMAERKIREEGAVILQQLAALLDEQPETRQTLRHLVFVEQALGKKGLRALHKLPLNVLQRALEQLEGLVTNWSPVGLASLRSKMAVAILDREHHDPEAETDAYRTAAVLDTAPVTAPEPDTSSDDEALAAAYAALGAAAPVEAVAVQMQAELGSRSSRALSAPAQRSNEQSAEIHLRELQA
jgi:hypothetical protein